jgi:hypothetical protein
MGWLRQEKLKDYAGFRLCSSSYDPTSRRKRPKYFVALRSLRALRFKKKLKLETLNLEVAIGGISHEHQNIDQNRGAGF